jgi:DNA ligase (NAD+)
MDIEGLGPETIDVLIRNGLARDIDDLYTFDPARLLELPGFGEKKVAQIREGIEKSKGQPFHIVFPSLGIPEIGQKVTELLIESGYTDVDRILALADSQDTAPLLEIHGIGERTAEILIAELRNPQVKKRIEGLRRAGLQMREEASPASSDMPQTFAGQTWCVTGSFTRWSPRERAMEEVAKRGGKVSAAVTSKTTHLLVGENPGSKLEKARKLGAAVVTEREFDDLLGTP